ncbi:hypothetical protein BDC45DRAFT_478481 [Circinella umbellata]|nr:hypothetical protein BDC45DRAFT_478481 [Circinella umbellata]
MKYKYLQKNVRRFFSFVHSIRPSTDLLSRTVLKDQRVISPMARSLTDVLDDTYNAGQYDFVDGTACNVLYIRRLTDTTGSATSPLAINVRSSVEEARMSQIIYQCACIYE